MSYRTAQKVPSLFIGDRSGTARLFQSDSIAAYGIIYTKKLLKSAKITDSSNVFFKDNIVGSVLGLTYSPFDDVLSATFKLTNSGAVEEVRMSTDEFKIIPVLKFNMVGCCSCGDFFEPGSSPCECIEAAEQIFIDQVLISGLKICHYMEYIDIEQKTKKQIFLQHFGGAMGAIEKKEN